MKKYLIHIILGLALLAELVYLTWPADQPPAWNGQDGCRPRLEICA